MDPQSLQILLNKYPMKLLANGNIRTCPVRLSYTNGLFVARAVEEGKDKKYSVSLLFPVGTDLSLLYNVANQTAVEHFGNTPPTLKNPFLKQGDVPDPGYEDGGIYLRCGAPEQNQPQCSDLTGRILVSERDVYSGCWALATIRCFAYPKKGAKSVIKPGVSFGVQNVLKIADDDKFSGRATAAEDFEDIIQSNGAATGGANTSQGPGGFFN